MPRPTLPPVGEEDGNEQPETAQPGLRKAGAGSPVPYRAELTDGVPLELVPYVIFDTETTGAERGQDRVIELALYRYFRGELVAALTVLLDPKAGLAPREISDGAAGAHGFSDEKLAGLQPIPFSEAAPLVQQLLHGAVLGGHNVEFDLAMLRYEFELWARTWGPLPCPPEDYFDACVYSGYRVCTLALARTVFPEARKHKLEAVVELLGLPSFHAHRAAGDAKMTYAILHPLLKMWRARNEGRDPTLKILTSMSEWPYGKPAWLARKEREAALVSPGTRR